MSADTIDSATLPLAVLIDGDNAQPSLIEDVLAEAAKHGDVIIRRIYGDWTTKELSGWKDYINSHAITPMQQFRNTVGKNSTDSAMIIDAMEILHSKDVRGFCLVSSDSDYTSLAVKIREKGLFVMGIGMSTTPQSLRTACNVFVYTENLSTYTESVPRTIESTHPDWRKIVKEAIEMSAVNDGWAHLGAVGISLRKIDPAFDPRTYGHRQMLLLIKSDLGVFEIKMHQPDNNPPIYYVRVRPQYPERRTDS